MIHSPVCASTLAPFQKRPARTRPELAAQLLPGFVASLLKNSRIDLTFTDEVP
jgi:hypothetical protein